MSTATAASLASTAIARSSGALASTAERSGAAARSITVERSAARERSPPPGCVDSPPHPARHHSVTAKTAILGMVHLPSILARKLGYSGRMKIGVLLGIA